FNDTPGRAGPPVMLPPCDVRGSYHHFLEHGELPGLPYYDFWTHTHGWWEAASLPNVLLAHFNSLKADLGAEIRRIAAFLDIAIDGARWPALLEHCTFAYMHRESAKMSILEKIFTRGGQSLVHKGTNGRWKDVLTA